MIKKIISLISLSFFLALPSFASTFYVLPTSNDLYMGDTFIIEPRINTEDEDINAVELRLFYSTDLLEVVSLEKGGSVLELWTAEPKTKNGQILFEGGIPNGFVGDANIGRIIFKTLNEGRADVIVGEDSVAYLNDGEGTKIAPKKISGFYNIAASPHIATADIISEDHPDQNQWYVSQVLTLSWETNPEHKYSYLLSADPLMEPDDEYEDLVGAVEFDGLKDGIYYFHLKEQAKDGVWLPKTTFRVMIDATPPEEIQASVSKDEQIFNGEHFLNFVCNDKTSGIDYYEIAETKPFQKPEWKRAKSPYLLEDQTLQSEIKIKAVDKAGNIKIILISPQEKIWKGFILLGIIIVMIAIIVVACWSWVRSQRRRG